jgi:hypothetical protein
VLETATDEEFHRVGGLLDEIAENSPLCRGEAF